MTMNPRFALSLLLLPLAGSLTYAQAPAPEAALAAAVTPTAGSEAEIAALLKVDTPLKEDAQLVKGQLANGLSYIIRPTKEPAGQACMRLYVDTGSLNESAETSGISHFIEHMVFNGSRHFKRGELIPAMQNLGLGFGGDANAYTALLQTVFMLDLPNLKPETVDFALTIMRDFADGATLEDDAIEHERGIIVSELKARDSAAYRAGIESLRKFVGGTRIPDYLPIGTEEVIRNCPAETIRQYYRENYIPARMTFIVTGDVDPAVAVKWIEDTFSSMEARPNPPRPAIGTPSDTGTGSFVVPNAETATTTITLAVVDPWKERTDSLEQRIADMPLELACSMLNQRLARMARQEGSPFLSSGTTPREEIYEAAELFALRVLTRPEQWKEGFTAAEAELRRAAQYGFSSTELMEAVAAINATNRKAVDTWETVAADAVAGGLVDSLDGKTLFTDPDEDARADMAGILRVLANPDICREALAKAYEADRARLVLTGKVAEGATAEGLAEAYATARQQEVAPPAEEKLEPFAYDEVGEPGKVVNRQAIDDVGITTLTFANGVRVNLKPIDFKKGSIYVSAQVDGGMMQLPKVPALVEMTDAVMSQGGLEAHSVDELDRLFAGNNVSCSFGMDDERFIFAGQTTPQELELQCKLLCASIMHPGFRNDGEVQLRRALPSLFRRIETTPEGAYADQSMRKLFGDDMRFLTPTPEQFAAVDTAAVKAAITPFLEKGAIEVTLVGDFKVEDVLPVLERSFGAMPQRAPEFAPVPDEAREVTFQPCGQREFLRYDTELDKTIVTQVFPAGDGRDRHRNRRLKVLGDIVRERLFDTIRAELGESYSPSMRLEQRNAYDNAATFAASSFGVKGNREKVTAAMDIVFADVGRGDITEEEFQQALRPYINDADESYRQMSFWAANIARLQSDPLYLDLLRDYLDDVRNISLEEIRTLAKDIFGGGKVNYYYTVPQDYAAPGTQQPKAEAPAEETSAEPAAALLRPKLEPAAYAYVPTLAASNTVKGKKAKKDKGKKKAKPAKEADDEDDGDTASAKGKTDLGSPYGVFLIGELADQERTKEVKPIVTALLKKYENARCVRIAEPREDAIAEAIRKNGFRYAAFIIAPKELGREVISTLHRATRKVDDDPWGDCLWGVITGATTADMKRIAAAKKPLVIKRLLGTTNVGAGPFEYSYCITDWSGAPVLEQSGYKEPETKQFGAGEGREDLFGEQLSGKKPQLIVTSSHATQFNLEMPFGKGLIFPAKGKFYLLKEAQKDHFFGPLGAAMQGRTQLLDQLADSLQLTAIDPDGEPRVWLAAGNCLFGNAQHSAGSMAVTALSAYTCNQVVGYTVPSWFGKGGWGTLSMFCENTDGTTLAEAWYLNNQFILDATQKISPRLLDLEFNDGEMGAAFIQAATPTLRQLRLPQDKGQEALGLIHDRDVVAFYGDPAWSATIDSSHCQRPFRIEWTGDKSFTITANSDRKGRVAVWFPKAATGKDATGCDAKGAIFTNDFILFPELNMQKGETLEVNIR